jgi:REP element-mobilizing transposase RayT
LHESGVNNVKIFPDDRHKSMLVKLLAEYVRRYRMRLFTYCVMDNHYHLVLENTSGRLSDFFKGLNTGYAFYYRGDWGQCLTLLLWSIRY